VRLCGGDHCGSRENHARARQGAGQNHSGGDSPRARPGESEGRTANVTLHHGLELQSRGKRKPRHVIGAGFSEAQLKFMTFCQAEEKRSQGAVGSDAAVAAYLRLAGLLGLLMSLRLLGSYF
jgi:hypothetical protein